jgi:transposase-like protein
MGHYRLPELDLSTRMTLAVEMLQPIPEREWGRVTELAGQYGISRELLYQLRDQAREGLRAALTPRQPGPPPQVERLTIDRDFMRRAIVVLPLLKGSVRDIQQGLGLLFGRQRSVGYISQTLQAAGEQATIYNQGVRVPVPILGEADEIFQGRKPCLTVVDGRSFLVVNLTPAERRDGTTWGVTYLNLIEQGIQFQNLACDGGTGLQAGLKEAALAIPLRPDLFHLLQEAHRLTRRLERAAYKALETADRAGRDDLERRGLIRRRGRRLKISVPLAQAEIEAARAVECFDAWRWLLSEIRSALEPISPTDRFVSVTTSQATLQTAITLLKELARADITAFADDLQDKLPDLLAPCSGSNNICPLSLIP